MTILSQARHHRWYEDACATAQALGLLGERRALLVMRQLMWGPKRFTDLRASLPEISANVLTQRLEGLEAASTQVYELTPWGYESEPIFQALGRWAARSPTHDPTLRFSATSLLLSLRTMLDPVQAGGMDGRKSCPASKGHQTSRVVTVVTSTMMPPCVAAPGAH